MSADGFWSVRIQTDHLDVFPLLWNGKEPALAADTASAGLATVTHTSVPAACSAVMSAGSGQPNVNDVTGTGSAVSRASFAAQSSSSNRGGPSVTPAARASASIVAA